MQYLLLIASGLQFIGMLLKIQQEIGIQSDVDGKQPQLELFKNTG